MLDEIKNGFYPGFERQWRRAELVGRAAMLLVVGGTMVGLSGGGPASLWTSEVAEGAVRVGFPPIVRFGTPTGITLHVTPRAGNSRATVVMPAEVVRKCGLQSVYPHPVEWRADRGGDVFMTFAVQPGLGEIAVEVGGMPVSSGIVKLSAGLGDELPVSWSQVILP